MSKKKEIHPADAAVLAGIAKAVSWAVYMLRDQVWEEVRSNIATLAQARAEAAELAVGASRKPGVYAIDGDGKAYLVPPSYDPAAIPTTTADRPVKPAKPAAAKKPTPAKKPAKAAPKKAAKKAGASKTDIAVKLLTRPQGATRKEVTDATEWPSINLKPIAKRRKMKLVEKEGVLRMVAA